ncbi:MAG: hypothetical protein II836_11160 [Clostridia bacterium]|nr:hypothetical protein [Clostridia bacterium]
MKKRKILAAAMAALTLALPLAACKKTEKGDGAADEGPKILEHVFEGTVYALPEPYSILDGAEVTWDAETGELSCAASAFIEGEPDEEGFADYRTEYAAFTLNADGVVRKQEIEAPGDGYVSTVIAGEDSTVFLWQNYDDQSGAESWYLTRIDANGVRTDSPELSTFFPDSERGWFFINHIAADGDGDIYLNFDQEIVVLNRDFTLRFAVSSPGWINSMAASPDGTVMAVGYFNDSVGIAPIDKAAKKLGSAADLPSGVSDVYFGAGHDFYYTDDDGVWAADLGKDGKYASTPILNYINSNLSRSEAQILAVADAETILFAETTDEESMYRSPSVWRHAADVDLSAITVIELAYADYLDYQIPGKIVKFNRAHPDIRIVTTDYSRYNTNEDWGAGQRKLATELVNGLYKPDLVLGRVDDASSPISALFSKNLYTDLTPFVEKDEKFNRNNLFGVVLSAFTAADGTLRGLPTEVQVQSLLSTSALLGKYADQDGWTLGEMMEYAASLPEGVELMEGLTQDSMPYLLGDGYGTFIDEENAVCHFEDPDFLAFLNFVKSLPKTWDEYHTKSAFGELDYDEQYRLYHEGKVALKNVSFYDIAEFLNLEMAFGTKDYKLIGYPRASAGVSGSKLASTTTAVITKYAENLDAAWEAMKAILDPDGVEYYDGIPILRSTFDQMVEEYYSYRFEFYYDGSASWGTYDPDNPDDQRTTEDLDRPGVVTYFTKEDADRIKAFLDEPVSPVGGALNEEVTAIIREEVSAFLGGSVDAAGCAKRIQSRVSIWLAEHQ